MTDLLTEPDRELGVFLRREALAAGVHEREITRLVRQGRWVRLRHGGYTTREIWDPSSTMDRHALVTRSVLRSAKTDVVASHVSALPEYAAPSWGLDLDTVHITRRDQKAGRSEAGVRQHQGLLLPTDLCERRGIAVTSATRTALDVTTVLGAEAGLVQVCHLLHTKQADLSQLRERYESMERHPFTLRTDLVLRLADPLLESVGESRTLFLCYRHSLPRPVLQHEVFDVDGTFVARLDFAWPTLRRWMEFDGRSKYVNLLREGETAADAVIREKRREDLVRRLTGWQCLRITWADLERPIRTAAMIRAFLDVPGSPAEDPR